jgi:hypothetical protein
MSLLRGEIVSHDKTVKKVTFCHMLEPSLADLFLV